MYNIVNISDIDVEFLALAGKYGKVLQKKERQEHCAPASKVKIFLNVTIYKPSPYEPYIATEFARRSSNIHDIRKQVLYLDTYSQVLQFTLYLTFI